jgi:hypothetical protein
LRFQSKRCSVHRRTSRGRRRCSVRGGTGVVTGRAPRLEDLLFKRRTTLLCYPRSPGRQSRRCQWRSTDYTTKARFSLVIGVVADSAENRATGRRPAGRGWLSAADRSVGPEWHVADSRHLSSCPSPSRSRHRGSSSAGDETARTETAHYPPRS